MKVAIVTTQYAVNYGALLQAYALSSFLNEEMDAKCDILAYWPPFYRASWRTYELNKDLRTFIRNVYMFLNRPVRKLFERRIAKVAAFMDEYLPRSQKHYYSAQELYNSPPDYDCYICGSDQIWNLALRHDPIFFLDFTKSLSHVKKIAYAPSITDRVPEDRLPFLKQYLENMDFISVREAFDVPFLETLTEKEVHHVIDPVYLFCADRWSKLAVEPDITGPYILCYFLSCYDLAVEAVKRLKEMTGYPVVYVNLMARDRLHADLCIRDADPRQFIGYIKNATFVCTNSYHATVFSTIYHKNYCVIPKFVSNSRMESLQQRFKLGNRIFDSTRVANLSEQDLIVDYSRFDSTCTQFRDYSINYLMKALGIADGPK